MKNLGLRPLIHVYIIPFLTFPLFLGPALRGSECIDKIISIKSTLEKTYVDNICKSIHKYTKKYKIESQLMIAIIAQESMFQLDAKNCYKGKCRDFGLTQINLYNIKALNIDVDRLLSDIDYAIMWGYKIMKFWKQYEKDNPYLWWVRYNCGYGDVNRSVCMDYANRVMRWY